MDTNTRVLELEDKVVSLSYDILVLKNIIKANQPDWAKDAWGAAESLGIKPSPYGESFDLYRILDLLNRLGLLSQD